jgi:hypothetical protein
MYWYECSYVSPFFSGRSGHRPNNQVFNVVQGEFSILKRRRAAGFNLPAAFRVVSHTERHAFSADFAGKSCHLLRNP